MTEITERGRCRFCENPLQHSLLDLGMSPPCNNILAFEQLNAMEAFYPLNVFICEQCFLVQLLEYVSPGEIFSNYSYFSSYSESWLKHAKLYTEKIVKQFNLNSQSQVVEIASNDGYLLQNFVTLGIPALGIEPAANVAEVAINKGIPTLVNFFGTSTATELVIAGKKADLIIGNNVLAHVPNLNDFVAGMKILLKENGIITMEFPHLLQLIAENQFDTIYHEHFSYFSLTTVEQVFAKQGLTLFDVEELSTHGGSLRIYVAHKDNNFQGVSEGVTELKLREKQAGLTQLEFYFSFAEKVKETKRKLLQFLITAKAEAKSIVGYGAPGKGNTLLNYCGIRGDFLDYTVDRSPYKQGKFLPGTHIPIFAPEKIRETKPDYVLILPWNLREEIIKQTNYIQEWGGKFVVPIPEIKIY